MCGVVAKSMMSEQSGVVLMPFTKSHINSTYHWVTDFAFQRLFLMREKPTLAKHVTYFENMLKDDTQKVYAIVCQKKHTGNCGIKLINNPQGNGELWLYVGEPGMRGQGIGSSATYLLIQEAFGRLKLARLFVHVATFNKIALKMYMDLGFSEVEGDAIPAEWNDRSKEIIRMRLDKPL